jgi:hypothetical protein
MFVFSVHSPCPPLLSDVFLSNALSVCSPVSHPLTRLSPQDGWKPIGKKPAPKRRRKNDTSEEEEEESSEEGEEENEEEDEEEEEEEGGGCMVCGDAGDLNKLMMCDGKVR